MIKITEHIFLKSISIDDAPIIINAIHANRKYLRVWLPFVDKTTKDEDIIAFIEKSAMNKERHYLIYYKNTFCGLVGLNNSDRDNNKTEIGYWIIESMQGKGLVVQSVSKLLGIAFNELKMNRVTIKAGVSNYKSRKIPEKLNFVFEGIERDAELLVDNKYTDLAIYSLLRKEYRS